MHVAHNGIPCTLYLLYMYFIVTVYSNVSIYLLYWNYYIIIPSRYILHALWIFNFWKLIIQKKMYLCDLITAFYRRKAWMLTIHFCIWSHHVKKLREESLRYASWCMEAKQKYIECHIHGFTDWNANSSKFFFKISM